MKKHFMPLIILLAVALMIGGCTPATENEGVTEDKPSFGYYIKYLYKIINRANKLQVSYEAEAAGVAEMYLYYVSPEAPSAIMKELIDKQENELGFSASCSLLIHKGSEVFEDADDEYSYIIFAVERGGVEYVPTGLLTASIEDGTVKLNIGVEDNMDTEREALNSMILVKVKTDSFGKDASKLDCTFTDVSD